MTTGHTHDFKVMTPPSVTVYQLPSPTSTKEDAVRIATFDIVDGIKAVRDRTVDPVSGEEEIVVVQFGGDYGIERSFIIDKNYVNNTPLNNGSRYYFAPEFFLYFLSQLIHDFPNEYEKWKAQVIDAITKRIGTTKYPIDLAMRITSMKLLGLDNEIDKNSLLLLQDKNGNFPSDCIYKYGSKMGYFGSQTISNAFCAEALTEENDML